MQPAVRLAAHPIQHLNGLNGGRAPRRTQCMGLERDSCPAQPMRVRLQAVVDLIVCGPAPRRDRTAAPPREPFQSLAGLRVGAQHIDLPPCAYPIAEETTRRLDQRSD